MTDPDEVLEQARAAIANLRRTLTQRHGWTHLEVEATCERPGRITLRGQAVVDRVVDAVVRSVSRGLPQGWSLDSRELTTIRGGAWRALGPGVHRLYARLDRQTTGWGAWVEITERDDPVQVLAQVDDMTLVRGRDATVGWVHGSLGEKTAPRLLQAPSTRDPTAMIDAARAMLGVAYRLGGATSEGIDCSALVQQTAGALRLLVPRHSSDQLQIEPQEGNGRDPGDLAFAWNEREALCHVGVVSGPTVIHASRSRGLVVEDPLAAFEDGSRRLMHVAFCRLVAFGERVAGFESLTAAGFVVGRSVPSPPE